MIFIKIGKLQIGRNKNIEKKDYETKQEFKYDRATDLVPKKKNRIFCFMLSAEGGFHIIQRKLNVKSDEFKFKNGLYIIDKEALHIASNGARAFVYMEGISTPLKMSNIQTEHVDVDYIDLFGNKKTSPVERIKGLKFDAKILDTFANRKFAELFTKTPTPLTGLLTLILSVIIIIMVGITYGVVYYFR